MVPQSVLDNLEWGFVRHLERLRRWVSQPSISATGEGMAEMAKLVMKALDELHAGPVLHETEGWPIITGFIDAGKPRTVLVYGMYDVQPVEGETWSVDPWSASIVKNALGDCVIGRGVYNSKGPLAGTIAGIHAIRRAGHELPVNIKFLVEGEEELASRSLPAFLEKERERLRCDAIYGPFYGQNRRGVPTLKLGFKGVQFCELHCRGGAWGGPRSQGIHGAEAAWIANPAWQLVRTLATLVDEHDVPVVDGLRGGGDSPLVEPLAAVFDPTAMLEQQDVARFKHDGDTATQLRHYLYDAVINLDGMTAGYTGKGTKAMVPHVAAAKLSIRLVPGMELARVREALVEHVARVSGGAVTVHFQEGYPPSQIDPSSPLVQAMIESLRVSGKEPLVFPFHGGSAPFSMISDELGAPFLPGGLGHGGNQHAPDEYATIEGMQLFERGFVELLYRFA